MGYGDMTPSQIAWLWIRCLAIGAACYVVRRPLQLVIGALYWAPIYLLDKLRGA